MRDRHRHPQGNTYLHEPICRVDDAGLHSGCPLCIFVSFSSFPLFDPICDCDGGGLILATRLLFLTLYQPMIPKKWGWFFHLDLVPSVCYCFWRFVGGGEHVAFASKCRRSPFCTNTKTVQSSVCSSRSAERSPSRH